MIRLFIAHCCLLSISVYAQAQPKPQPVVYSQIASELCHCMQTNDQKDLTKRFESCYLLSIKKHDAAIRQQALDFSNTDDKRKIIINVMDEFEKECPETCAKYRKTMDEKYPADPFAGLPSFTGSFVSETFLPDKKGYSLVLRSDSGVTKEFFTPSQTPVDKHAAVTKIIVKYKIIPGKTKNKPTLYVEFCEVAEGVSEEYLQKFQKKSPS